MYNIYIYIIYIYTHIHTYIKYIIYMYDIYIYIHTYIHMRIYINRDFTTRVYLKEEMEQGAVGKHADEC